MDSRGRRTRPGTSRARREASRVASPATTKSSKRAAKRRAQILRKFRNRRRRIVPPINFKPRHPAGRSQKLRNGFQAPRQAAFLPHSEKEPVQVAQPPTETNPHPIREDRFDIAVERKSVEQVGEIDARINRELQRAPETAVDLQELGDPISGVAFEFQHRHAVPLQGFEDPPGMLQQLRIQTDAFGKDRDAPRGRLLADSPMGEGRAQASPVHQDEDSPSIAWDMFLDQRTWNYLADCTKRLV